MKIQSIITRYFKSSLHTRIFFGFGWSMFGGVFSRIFTLIANVTVARILGKEAFGEFGVIQSTMLLFGIMAGFGMGSIATRFIALNKSNDPEKASRIINFTLITSAVFGLIVVCCCCFASEYIANALLNRPSMVVYIKSGAIFLFFTTINNILLAIISGFELFKQIAKINIVQGLVSPLIAIPFALFYGVSGVIASFTINAAFGVILCALRLRKACLMYNIPTTIYFKFQDETSLILKFALPAMLPSLIAVASNWIMNLMLVKQPNGYSEMGLFNAASQWRTVIIFLPSLMSSVVLPILSESSYTDSDNCFGKTLNINYTVTWTISLPFTVFIITFGNQIASLFGKEFKGMAPVMIFLVISCFFMVINSSLSVGLVGAGRMWINTLLNTWWAIILLSTSYFLIPTYGAIGLSVSNLVAFAIQAVSTLTYLTCKYRNNSVNNEYKSVIFSSILFAISSVLVLNNFAGVSTKILFNALALLPVAMVFKSILTAKGREIDDFT